MKAAYSIWAVLVFATLGYAQYTGWSFDSAAGARTDPRSVRNNPGSYRSTYYSPGRVLRGK